MSLNTASDTYVYYLWRIQSFFPMLEQYFWSLVELFTHNSSMHVIAYHPRPLQQYGKKMYIVRKWKVYSGR